MPLPKPAGPFKVETGQVLYSTPKLTIVGDFVTKISPTDFFLNISKGPGASLITIRSHNTNGEQIVRFEGGGHHWQGSPRFAPDQLKPWLALREVLRNRPAPAGCDVTRSAGEITVNFPARHERFVFHFNR